MYLDEIFGLKGKVAVVTGWSLDAPDPHAQNGKAGGAGSGCFISGRQCFRVYVRQ